jgi:hypothetical protein
MPPEGPGDAAAEEADRCNCGAADEKPIVTNVGLSYAGRKC